MSSDAPETYAAFKCDRCRQWSEGDQCALTIGGPLRVRSRFRLCESCARAAKRWVSDVPGQVKLRQQEPVVPGHP